MNSMDRYKAEEINEDVSLANRLIGLLTDCSKGDTEAIERGKSLRAEIIKDGPIHSIDRFNLKCRIINLGFIRKAQRD